VTVGKERAIGDPVNRRTVATFPRIYRIVHWLFSSILISKHGGRCA
jgi:hypothetical protein